MHYREIVDDYEIERQEYDDAVEDRLRFVVMDDLETVHHVTREDVFEFLVESVRRQFTEWNEDDARTPCFRPNVHVSLVGCSHCA